MNNVVSALKEKPKDVTLTVRKGPRHYNLPSTQRRPSPKANLTLGENLKQSTFPKVCIRSRERGEGGSL